MKPATTITSVESRSRRVDGHTGQKPSFGSKPLADKRPPTRRNLEQHEAALIPSIRSRTPIVLVMIDGTRMEGVIPIGFDRYSIGIEFEGNRESVFKSSIARIITPIGV